MSTIYKLKFKKILKLKLEKKYLNKKRKDWKWKWFQKNKKDQKKLDSNERKNCFEI